jgi:starvation-inducible DNA-binding protein
MYRDPIHLVEATRAKLVALLNSRLADGIDLLNHARQAHWNVHRRRDLWLHQLFDEAYDKAEECVELIAERATELAGTALGCLWISARRATLRELPAEASPGSDHVAALSRAIRAFADSARQGSGEASALGDAETAGVLAEVACELDRLLAAVLGHGAAHA